MTLCPGLLKRGSEPGATLKANQQKADTVEEGENGPNIRLQEKFHRAISKGVINIPDTP